MVFYPSSSSIAEKSVEGNYFIKGKSVNTAIPQQVFPRAVIEKQ